MKKLITILAVIAMVGAFTATGMAAEWDFYGSARMSTIYSSVDDGVDATDDAKNLSWDLQGNSRIGANVKVNDEIGGRFEYGSGPSLRLLYGTYNFGGGELLVGQSYTPVTYFYSTSVYGAGGADDNLLGVGNFYGLRKPMIQLKMASFKVALVQPNVDTTLTGATATEQMLPKIEASYGFKTDQFFIDVFGGYQTYEESNAAGDSEDIASYVAGLGGGANFGGFFFKAQVHMTQNQGQYGAYNPAEMSNSAEIVGGELVDNDGLGYLLVLGYKISDAMALEFGYGYEECELDTSGASTDETVQYYGNLSYTITPGFFIVPEIGIVDFEDDAEKGEVFYAGLKWQINF